MLTWFKKHFLWEWLYFSIFLIPLVVDPAGLMPYEIPKQAWMILVITIFLLVTVSNIWRESVSIVFNKKIVAAAVLCGIVGALSLIFSITPQESFWGSFERMQGVVTFFFYGLHFFICLQLLQKQDARKFLMGEILVIGLVLSAHAILQKFQIDPLKLGDLNEVSGRSVATIGQPNLLGQLLIFPFFIALFYAQKYWKKHKIFLPIAFVMVSAGLFTTWNRGAFVAIGLTILILGFDHVRQKKIGTKLLSVLMAVTVVSVGIFFFLKSDLRSADSRMILWRDSIPLISKNLLVEIGRAHV